MQVTSSFLLFLVFLVLKLTEVITWSWLWVTSPLWIPLAIVLIVIVCCLSFAGVAALLDKDKSKKVK